MLFGIAGDARDRIAVAFDDHLDRGRDETGDEVEHDACVPRSIKHRAFARAHFRQREELSGEIAGACGRRFDPRDRFLLGGGARPLGAEEPEMRLDREHHVAEVVCEPAGELPEPTITANVTPWIFDSALLYQPGRVSRRLRIELNRATSSSLPGLSSTEMSSANRTGLPCSGNSAMPK